MMYENAGVCKETVAMQVNQINKKAQRHFIEKQKFEFEKKKYIS